MLPSILSTLKNGYRTIPWHICHVTCSNWIMSKSQQLSDLSGSIHLQTSMPKLDNAWAKPCYSSPGLFAAQTCWDGKKTTCRNLKWGRKPWIMYQSSKTMWEHREGSMSMFIRFQSASSPSPGNLTRYLPPCHPQENKENNQPLFAAPAFSHWMQIMIGVKGVNSSQF